MTILRPLSPHLPIYKPQLTSTFPIFHRICGAFLATIVFFFYFLCLKIGLICFTYENVYLFFFYSSKLILISVEITALALSYHLYNGVRHLLTDFSGLNKKEMYKLFRFLLFAFLCFLIVLKLIVYCAGSPVPERVIIPRLDLPINPDDVLKNFLYDRYFIKKGDYSKMDSILDLQFTIQRAVEEELVERGYDPNSIIKYYAEFAEYLHSPFGKLLSANTYRSYISDITSGRGIGESTPFRRVISAIEN